MTIVHPPYPAVNKSHADHEVRFVSEIDVESGAQVLIVGDAVDVTCALVGVKGGRRRRRRR